MEKQPGFELQQEWAILTLQRAVERGIMDRDAANRLLWVLTPQTMGLLLPIVGQIAYKVRCSLKQSLHRLRMLALSDGKPEQEDARDVLWLAIKTGVLDHDEANAIAARIEQKKEGGQQMIHGIFRKIRDFEKQLERN